MIKILVSILIFAASVAQAKTSIFYSESLNCKGFIQGDDQGVHSDYDNIAIQVTSFWSVRKKDCSLAPSVEAKFDYPEDLSQLNLTAPDFGDELGSSHWYGGPMIFNSTDQTVIVPVLQSYFADPLKLKMTKSNGKSATFEGIWDQGDTPAATTPESYGYKLTCVARLSKKEDLQILNATKNCTNFPFKEYLD